MTITFDWYAKPFTPGDMDGGAGLKLLGKPALGHVTTLIRETAQNSWDARKDKRGPIDFDVAVRTLEGEALDTLRKRVFKQRGHGTNLTNVLHRRSVRALEITDRGTIGLDGPVRVDVPVPQGQPTNFRDLVLSVGATHDKGSTGGTYGFGKAITYMASTSRTIIVYSRCKVGRSYDSRLIASAMGENFDLAGKRYTGRQWWGVNVNQHIEPVTGRTADKVAASLFSRPFKDSETGTSLLIIEPTVAKTQSEAVSELADAVLWHLWPKMVPVKDGGQPPMRLRVLHEDDEVALPNPASHPILAGYVKSLQAVRRAQSPRKRHEGTQADGVFTTVGEIKRFQTTVGHLAITKESNSSNATSVEALDYSDRAHHVALMRHDTELVVKYLEQSESAVPGVHFCGVFRSDEKVDEAFAEAEPPAHDTWEYKAVADERNKSIVRVALRKLGEVWESRVLPATEDGPNEQVDGLGQLARRLNFLVDGLGGTGAGPNTGGSGGGAAGSSSSKGSIKLGVANRWPLGADRYRVAVPFSLTGALADCAVSAAVGIGFDGGTAPDSQDVVHILGFVKGVPENPRDAEAVSVSGSTLTTVGGQRQWALVVDAPRSVATDITLDLVHLHSAPSHNRAGQP